MIKDVLPLIPTIDLAATTAFYRDALGLVVVFESDWYCQLHGEDQPAAQLALIVAGHASVPEHFRAVPQGVIITLETENADAVYARALAAAAPMHVSLRDEEWGQRHFVTEDPNGLMVDVVQMLAS